MTDQPDSDETPDDLYHPDDTDGDPEHEDADETGDPIPEALEDGDVPDDDLALLADKDDTDVGDEP